ncbi:hypothetical protein E2C01_063432 [Portunus trituberculatus]|uniref:Uncharacterized protein n=1 Tax=Portunus trituberculatus TaxID=210409 RepID=A0A5B7HI48_PORTR|nr:hypothetical protein [Portunus trituberculatus]
MVRDNVEVIINTYKPSRPILLNCIDHQKVAHQQIILLYHHIRQRSPLTRILVSSQRGSEPSCLIHIEKWELF